MTLSKVRPGGRRDGDGRADFTGFYVRSYSRTVASVYLVVGALAEAEDVVQAAYERAVRQWDRVGDHEDPERWVRRVAFRLALSGLSRAWRRFSRAFHSRPEAAIHIPRHAVDLHRALRQFPPRQRAVVVLHYFHDESSAQVAEDLRIPVGTVEVWLRYARARLVQALSGAHDGTEVGRDG